MKPVPKWMYSPMMMVAHPQSTAREIAAIIDIESREYKAAGRTDAARALRNTATRLRRIASGEAPVKAFDWPPQSAALGESAKEKP